MAPIKPRAKASNASRRPTTSTTTRPATSYPSTNDTLASTKRDKRQIKHSLLLSKVQKSTRKPLKRRRPSKKLGTTLDSLADALPDLADAADGEDQAGRAREARQKSLKTRPGSMKRKVKVEQAERERMGLNMAQIAKAGGGGLEALRRHLKENMGSVG